MKPLRLYWAACGYRCGNAGDEVNAEIVAWLSGRKVERVASPEDADLISGGSIMHHVPPWFSGAIWGTGSMAVDAAHGDRVVSLPMARIHAVRGRLTAARMLGCKVPSGKLQLGDPGLLVSELWPSRVPPEQRSGIGWVPHYVDADNEEVREWCREHREVRVIDICQRPRDVVAQISECAFVLSSSLHGLVFADSLGVPNAWVRLSDKLAGGDFKFHDYYSAYGMQVRTYPFDRDTSPRNVLAQAAGYSRPGIDELKAALAASFPRP